MAYLFCLFDAQRGSRRRAGRMNGDRWAEGEMTRPPAMRLRVVSIRAVSRSERGSGSGCLYVATLLFIYLKEAKLADWRRLFSKKESLPLIDIPEAF